MTDKTRTQRNRVLAKQRIKETLGLFYREDLAELQQAIYAALLVAQRAPAEDKLTAPGQWLEERHVANKSTAAPGNFYVYLRWIDDAGKERAKLVFHGTLAEYKASRI